MSRPPTSDRERIRDAVVRLRVSRDQRRRYESRAKRLGVSVSQWLRSLADRDSRM